MGVSWACLYYLLLFSFTDTVTLLMGSDGRVLFLNVGRAA